MIDLRDLPFPPDAPEEGACIRIERPEPGLAVIVFDPPHRSLAVLDAPLIRDLDAAVTELENDPQLRGVVITGRDPLQFAAGADVTAIGKLDRAELVAKLVTVVHGLFDRIASLKATTVAAVGGPVPGGAFEISLACDWIVVTDDPKTRIGLPETQLGIIPGWGGSHRLPRRIGVPAALQAILTGRLFAAKKAWKKGLVDRMAKPEALRRVAADIALGRERLKRKKRGWRGLLVDRNPAFLALARRQATKQVISKTRGQYPAPLVAIDIVSRSCLTPQWRWAHREASAIGHLAAGPVCKGLIRVFFGMEDAKRLGRSVNGAEPRRVGRMGVLGGGVMGGAIAGVGAEKGLSVRLMDLAQGPLDAAQAEHRASVDKKLRRRSIEKHEALGAIDRFEVTREPVGFARCGLVVEAVAERLDIKRMVLGKMAESVSEDAILATNTSSLSVDAIAEGLPNPERVCGMHFFNPVRKMPLVEVVRGSETTDEVVATVSALALKMGKTPVVVRDVAGFLVNRILCPYLDEAVRLFVEGADVKRVDHLMVAFGMPMGPFTLLDEVGLDIAQHAGRSLHEAYGVRMTPSDGLDGLVSPKRLGKKTGRGFYVHPRGKGRPTLSEDLRQFARGHREWTDEEIVDRLVLSMVNEAARCIEDEVVGGPVELDLATVLGMGFAPFRGGLLRYADDRGLGEIAERLEEISRSKGMDDRVGGAEKFAPAELIRSLAERGETFHKGLKRSKAKATAAEPIAAK